MEKVDEHLRCPICFEIPTAEIFQCRNGHHICKVCCSQLQTCPSCRINFENPKIRNRAMESLLDAMEFECTFKGKGCNDKSHRKNLMEHSSKCRFRPFHFCKLLGFKNCDFDARQHIPLLTVQHIQNTHPVAVRQARDLVVSHESFSNVTLSPRSNPASDELWQPVLVKLEKDNYGPIFMLLGRFIRGRFCYWICLYMSDSQEEASKFQFHFSIQNVFGHGQDTELKWTATPTPFKKVEDLLKKPPMTFPMIFFEKHVSAHLGRNKSLMLTVGIAKKVDKKPRESFDDKEIPLKIYLGTPKA